MHNEVTCVYVWNEWQNGVTIESEAYVETHSLWAHLGWAPPFLWNLNEVLAPLRGLHHAV